MVISCISLKVIIAIILLALVILPFYLYLYRKKVIRRVSDLLISRNCKTAQDFGDIFYPGEKKDTAIKVIEVIRKLYDQYGQDLNFSGVNPNDTFINDLELANIDSLGTVELIMELEEEFNIEICNSDAEKIQTVGALIDYVYEKTKSAGKENK